MTMSLPTAVRAELILRMVVDHERTIDVPCSFEFRTEEPFAIQVTFHTGTADIAWIFARDLLAEGMNRPSGEGDIVIWPEHGEHGQIVLLALNSPTGQAVLEADRAMLEVFLARTYDLVPPGLENAQIDVTGWIDAILQEGVK